MPPTVATSSALVMDQIRARIWSAKPLPPTPTLVDGVFEGGGTLGTAYVGSLRALADNNIWFARVVGNSAGAITAALVAVGFTAAEIQWLSAAFPEAPPIPASLNKLGIKNSIKFDRFLDDPSLATVYASREKTLLWNALKGDVIDEMARQPLPLQHRDQLAETLQEAILDFGLKDVPLLGDLTIRELFKKIPGAQAAPLKSALVKALATAQYPGGSVELGDFLPIMRSSLPWRERFADTAWSAILKNSPIASVLTNLLHEGSIFEGQVFLDQLRDLLSKKMASVNRPMTQPVLFKELKIPLAVIASDLETGSMVTYSALTQPDMEVAEAVRRSMSVPYVFQPRGPRRNLVDGGLCSNFPLWLFSDSGRGLMPAVGGDDARVKIGFQLDDSRAADVRWKTAPAKYLPQADDMTVLKEMLQQKLRPPAGLNQIQLNEFKQLLSRQVDETVLFREIMGMYAFNGEVASRPEIIRGLMSGRTYFDVRVPLRGYHWLDFDINRDEGHTLAMWDRGWHAAIESLSRAPLFGPAVTRLTTSGNSIESPYRGS